MSQFLCRIHETIADEKRQSRWLVDLFCAGVAGLMLYNLTLLLILGYIWERRND